MALPDHEDLMMALFIDQMMDFTDNPADRMGILKIMRMLDVWNKTMSPDDQLKQHKWMIRDFMTKLIGPPDIHYTRGKNVCGTCIWLGWRPRQTASV